MSDRSRRMCAGALLLAGYGALVAWLAWPLPAHMTSQLPAVFRPLDCDRHLSAWALAWSTRALTSDPWTIADANIYHPTPRALFYGQAGFGALPFFAPVFLLTGNPALALNVTLIAGLATSAWLFHLVVRWWTGSALAGFVAAATFLSSRFVLGYVRLGAALALVPLIVLQSLTETAYVAPAVFAPLGVLAMIRLVRPATRATGLRLTAALALAAAVLAPVYVEYHLVMLENPDLPAQTVWSTFPIPWSLPMFVGQMAPNQMAPVTMLVVVVGMAVAWLGGGQRIDVGRRRAWATRVRSHVCRETQRENGTGTPGSSMAANPSHHRPFVAAGDRLEEAPTCDGSPCSRAVGTLPA